MPISEQLNENDRNVCSFHHLFTYPFLSNFQTILSNTTVFVFPVIHLTSVLITNRPDDKSHVTLNSHHKSITKIYIATRQKFTI